MRIKTVQEMRNEYRTPQGDIYLPPPFGAGRYSGVFTMGMHGIAGTQLDKDQAYCISRGETITIKGATVTPEMCTD